MENSKIFLKKFTKNNTKVNFKLKKSGMNID